MTARPRVLLSYWYARKFPTAELQQLFAGADVILDSGGFSAHTSGAAIDLGAYAEWLRPWAGVATAAFSLDVIGDPVASLHNYRALLDAGTGVPIVPVFHAGSATRHLDALMDEGCTYVGFGGLVEHARHRHKAVLRWAAWNLRRCVHAGVAVHALGATGRVARLLPFYSVDSSAWMIGGRHGQAQACTPLDGSVIGVSIRDSAAVRTHAGILRDCGYDVARLLDPDFMRRGAGSPEDRADIEHLDMGGARAFMRMEEILAARRTVPAPSVIRPHTDPGTKVYLAATHQRKFAHLLAAWAAHTERTSV